MIDMPLDAVAAADPTTIAAATRALARVGVRLGASPAEISSAQAAVFGIPW